MAELRYIQKGWEIDSIAPVFDYDPTDAEVGQIEVVHIYTAEQHAEVARLRAFVASIESALKQAKEQS